MRFNSLTGWLDWQQTLHPKEIDLGLARVEKVYQRLALGRIASTVITVSGTNGKGSTVANYETWLHNRGHSVASYTSPHLLKYNERIKINRLAVSDEQLCETFEIIDQARGEIDLTYFEFGTLAALVLIHQFQPDYAILEVGLGGRLDAVNIIDADLAHITTIGLDHQDWLGDTRELIGAEKAGILRSGQKAICNDIDPPVSVLEAMENSQCESLIIARDYDFHWQQSGFIQWQCQDRSLRLKPALSGIHQAQNISGVLAGLMLLGCLDGVRDEQITQAFAGVKCAGRLQQAESCLPATILLDVGHNADAAAVLASSLARQFGSQRITVLLGMLEDKDSAAFVAALKSQVDEWWLLSLDCHRGLRSHELEQKVSDQIDISRQFNNIDEAMDQAMLSLGNQDILLITGSFMTVESALKITCLNSGS